MPKALPAYVPRRKVVDPASLSVRLRTCVDAHRAGIHELSLRELGLFELDTNPRRRHLSLMAVGADSTVVTIGLTERARTFLEIPLPKFLAPRNVSETFMAQTIFHSGERVVTTTLSLSPGAHLPAHWETVPPDRSLRSVVETHRGRVGELASRTSGGIVPVSSVEDYESICRQRADEEATVS